MVLPGLRIDQTQLEYFIRSAMPLFPPLTGIPAINQADNSARLRIDDLGLDVTEKSALVLAGHTLGLGYDT